MSGVRTREIKQSSGGSSSDTNLIVTDAEFSPGSVNYDVAALAGKTDYQIQIRDSSVFLIPDTDFTITATGISLLPGGQLPAMVADITLIFWLNF